LARVTAAIASGFVVSFFSLTSLAQSVDDTTAWTDSMIQTLVRSCLTIHGNMLPGVAVDLAKANIHVAPIEVSPSLILNGVTQRAQITVEVPVRTKARAAWTMARECFDYDRTNHFSTITPETGVLECQPSKLAIWGFVEPHSPEWPCRSRG
jgi:hypothetical protein